MSSGGNGTNQTWLATLFSFGAVIWVSQGRGLAQDKPVLMIQALL